MVADISSVMHWKIISGKGFFIFFAQISTGNGTGKSSDTFSLGLKVSLGKGLIWCSGSTRSRELSDNWRRSSSLKPQKCTKIRTRVRVVLCRSLLLASISSHPEASRFLPVDSMTSKADPQLFGFATHPTRSFYNLLCSSVRT